MKIDGEMCQCKVTVTSSNRRCIYGINMRSIELSRRSKLKEQGVPCIWTGRIYINYIVLVLIVSFVFLSRFCDSENDRNKRIFIQFDSIWFYSTKSVSDLIQFDLLFKYSSRIRFDPIRWLSRVESNNNRKTHARLNVRFLLFNSIKIKIFDKGFK
jgi:hypothetical protein